MTTLACGGKGLVVAVGNVAVIALCLAISERDPGLAPLVAMFAFLPALATGLVVGWVAGAMPKRPVWLRLVTLSGPAVGLVSVLGEKFHMHGYVVVASIPTIVACAVLERWTRWRPAEPIPPARVTA